MKNGSQNGSQNGKENKRPQKKQKVAVAVSVDDAKHPMTPEKKDRVFDALKECDKFEDCTNKVGYHYPDNDPAKGSPVAAVTVTPRHRLLEDKTKLTIETIEGEKIKIRGISLFNERILLKEQSPAQCIIITHQDLKNYKELPLYDQPDIIIGPVNLGPKVVPTPPRELAKQQNAVMHNMSANACMCIVNLLSKSKYDQDDLLEYDAAQLKEICDKEKVSGTDESNSISNLLTIKKYDMDYLLKCDDNQLQDICEKENFCGTFVWSHLGAYAVCVDQMDTQVPSNLNATPDSTNQWMKNGEDIANKKRKLTPDADVEYSVTSKRQRNPEKSKSDYIAAAAVVTQTFSYGGTRFSMFTDVQAKKRSRRCVGARVIGEAIIDTYLLQTVGPDKENETPSTDVATPVIPSSPSFKLKT